MANTICEELTVRGERCECIDCRKERQLLRDVVAVTAPPEMSDLEAYVVIAFSRGLTADDIAKRKKVTKSAVLAAANSVATRFRAMNMDSILLIAGAAKGRTAVNDDTPLRADFKPAWVWLLENGRIDDELASACVRYEQDFSLCGYDRGAGALDYSRDIVDGGSGGDMSDRRAVAQHRFSKVQAALPLKVRDVAMSCIGDGNSIRQHSRITGIHPDTVSKRLKEAIEIIAGPSGYRTKLPPVRHTIRAAFDMQEAA